MKRIRYIFTSIFLLLLLVASEVEVFAVTTGFSTESLSQDDVNTLLKNVNISILTNEPAKKSIECFDVSEDGLIAVGYSNLFENKTICVYTSDGTFLYGYTFKSSGDFGIEIRKDLLNIYLVRSDVSITLNPSGEVESVLKIQDTSENNSYWNHYVFLNKRKIGNSEYSLQNNLGTLNIFAWSSYSRVIATNESGETSVIYDATEEHLVETTFLVATLTVFFVMFFGIGIKQLIKKSRGY